MVYRIGDQYLPDRIAELDHFLRDHRTGDVKDYDLKEFDLLHDLMVKLGHPDGEIDIVCGYRTPWSNNYLREHGHGVAEHSQHMEAKAIDIRIPGVSSAEVRDAALSLDRGGVGYYAQSEFCSRGCRPGSPLVDLPFLRIRRPFGQHRIERPVVAVDVVEEIDFAIFLNYRGQIDNHHRNRRGQVYLLIIRAGLHRRLYRVECPFGLVRSSHAASSAGFSTRMQPG